MRIATFNLQNLRLRVKDGQARLDGAVDADVPDEPPDPAMDRADRMRTARVIAEARADVVALQEVFDQRTLDHFHDAFLLPAEAPDYPFRYCFPGNDGRGLDVAALSRLRPLRVESHAALTGADLGLTDIPPDLRDRPLFRRDCLELGFDGVTIFNCHFKAPYPDAQKARVVRDAEACGVRALIERRFADPSRAAWIVLGDFNEPGRDAGNLSALSGFAVDLMTRLPDRQGWTFEMPGTHLLSRPDRIFVSPHLAARYPETAPSVVRSGMDGAGIRPHASDHALVFADFPGLEA